MTRPALPTIAPVVPSAPDGLVVRLEPDDGTGLVRYTVFHVATGRRLSGPAGDRCAAHILGAVEIVGAAGVDWTSTGEPPAEKCMKINDQLRDRLGLCFDPETGRARRCAGDRPARSR